MIGSYARRLRDADYPWGADARGARRVLPDDPRRMGRPGRASTSARRRVRRRSGVSRVVGVVPAHGREPRRRRRADADERRDRRPRRAAVDPRADAGAASHRRSLPESGRGALPRVAHSRRDVRRAARRRSPAVRRRSGSDARRDRAVPRQPAHPARAGARCWPRCWWSRSDADETAAGICGRCSIAKCCARRGQPSIRRRGLDCWRSSTVPAAPCSAARRSWSRRAACRSGPAAGVHIGEVDPHERRGPVFDVAAALAGSAGAHEVRVSQHRRRPRAWIGHHASTRAAWSAPAPPRWVLRRAGQLAGARLAWASWRL